MCSIRNGRLKKVWLKSHDHIAKLKSKKIFHFFPLQWKYMFKNQHQRISISFSFPFPGLFFSSSSHGKSFRSIFILAYLLKKNINFSLSIRVCGMCVCVCVPHSIMACSFQFNSIQLNVFVCIHSILFHSLTDYDPCMARIKRKKSIQSSRLYIHI